MKRYWQFLIIGIICLLVALLWAQPPRGRLTTPQTVVAVLAGTLQSSTAAGHAATHSTKADNDEESPLPGSDSSLPLLGVVGFGVLAGGIISAMRTR